MAANDSVMRLDMVDEAIWNKVLALADKSTELLALLNNPVLPKVSSTDNGKVLTVVSGKWAKASLPE